MTDFSYAPDREYGGQWFDDMGAALLALGEPGLAWDLTVKTDIRRERLNEIIYRIGAERLSEGGLTT